MIVNALNQCKDYTDGACINSKIKSTKDFEGVAGVFTITPKGDAIRGAVINQIIDGKQVYKTTVNP